MHHESGDKIPALLLSHNSSLSSMSTSLRSISSSTSNCQIKCHVISNNQQWISKLDSVLNTDTFISDYQMYLPHHLFHPMG